VIKEKNMNSQTEMLNWGARLLLLCASGAMLVAQQPPQIASPLNGAVVNQGQTLPVTVTGTSFKSVALFGGGGLNFADALTTAPYQFQIPIPANLPSRRYMLSSLGLISPGNTLGSDPITIDVERSDTPQHLKIEDPMWFSYAGESQRITVTGIFADGSNVDLTESSRITYTSDTPGVATVDGNAMVTATGTGSAIITVNYANAISKRVAVTVPPSVKVLPAEEYLHPSETQQFFPVFANPSFSEGVNWTVDPAGSGTISSTGLYTAPSSIGARQTVTITATSVQDSTRSGSVQVSLYPPASISVTPASAALNASNTQQFMPALVNMPVAGVLWSLDKTVGSIDDNGLYTAPATVASQQIVRVTATSNVDGVTAGSATITIAPNVPRASMTANAGTTPQSATVGTAFANALAVTVKDAFNNAVAGVNVTFTAPGSGASGVFSNSTPTITVATNASGVAAPFTANATAGGPYTVTAAATGLTAVNFSLTNTTPPTVVSYSVLFGTQSYNVIGSTRVRLPWQITGIQVTFSKAISTGDINSLTGVTTTGFGGLETNTLTWTISPVALGNPATVLAGSGADGLKDVDGNGLTGGAGFAQALKVLWGDFNDDGVVTSTDFALVNNATSLQYNFFADANGDGVVDINDVNIVRGRNGTSLP
jgi:hypothetical protein